MTLSQAKKAAWKNQNPVILQVAMYSNKGKSEYVWMPQELINSQLKEFQSIIKLIPVYRWSHQDKRWNEIDSDIVRFPNLKDL